MKKNTLKKLMLILIPLVTVLVVSNPSGVTIFDGENTWYLSWMTLVSDSAWGWCAPVAGIANYLMFGLAVLYLVTKKQGWLKGIFGVGFAAVCIAVLPIIAQSEVKIVPNVLGVLLLAAEAAAAYLIMKNPEDQTEKKPKGQRLEKR